MNEPTYTITLTESQRTALARDLGLLVTKLMLAGTQIQTPPARPADPTSGTDSARAILSPPAAAQSAPTASPIALRDRWARDRKGVEVPNPKNASAVTVRIWKQERKDLADKTPRLKVAWANPDGKGFVDAACFDEKLFPWIAVQSKEPTALLYVVQNGKYLNIIGVRA